MHACFIAKVPSTFNHWSFAPCPATFLLLECLLLEELLLARFLVTALLLLGGGVLHSVAHRSAGISDLWRPCLTREHRLVGILLAASHGVLFGCLPPVASSRGAEPRTFVPCIVAMGVAMPPIVVPLDWVAMRGILPPLVLTFLALVVLLLETLVQILLECIVELAVLLLALFLTLASWPWP